MPSQASPNWDLVQVRGRFVATDGSPVFGRVIFTPRATRMVDQKALTTIIGRAIAATLDGDGQISVYLPASDDPDISPIGFTYDVKEEFKGGASYSISVPIAAVSTGLDLSVVAPAPGTAGQVPSPVTRLEFNELAALVAAGGGGGGGGMSAEKVDQAIKTAIEAAATNARKTAPVNAADYGFLPTATAEENDAAIAAALATGRTVHVKGYGGNGRYHITKPIVLDGLKNLLGDNNVHIVQDTNTADIVRITGPRNSLRGIGSLSHAAAPTEDQGRGVVFYAGDGGGAYLSHIETVEIVNCSTAFCSESGFFFSNLVENLFINGYAVSGIYFSNPGNTGSVWTNIYVNNQPNGTPLTCSGNPVVMEYADDTVINQLNIEHVIVNAGAALAMNGMQALTIAGLHIEGVSVMGWDGQYVSAYGDMRALISGLEIVQCDLAPTGAGTGSRSLLHAGGGAQVKVESIHCKNNTITVAQSARLAKVKDTGSVIWLPKMLTAEIFTAANTGDARTYVDSKDLATALSGLSTGGGGASGPVGFIRRFYLGTQPIASYTPSVVGFNNTLTNINGKFSDLDADNGAPINGIRCRVAGVIQVSAEIRFRGGSSAARQVSILQNGAGAREAGGTFAGNGRVALTSTLVVAAGDVITIGTYVEAGSVEVFADGNNHTGITCTYLGPAA